MKKLRTIFMSVLIASLFMLSNTLTLQADNNYALVTAYNLTGRMANGEYTSYGSIACPNSIRFGTIIAIDTLGTFVCADRYSDTLSFRFDIACPACSIDVCYSYTGFYKWTIIDSSSE